MFRSQVNKVLIVLFIIYLVGAIGHLISDVKPLFFILTPYNLIGTTLVLFYLNRPLRAKVYFISLVVFLVGFFIEVIGVKTGLLFGQYEYGATLGWKFLNVPIVIGLNWVLLSFTSNVIGRRYFKNIIVAALLSALLMVGLDLLIEPIAINLDYWSWENDLIPIQNYVMWFTTAFVIQLIINLSKVQLNFKVGLVMFLIQVMFFGILNLLL